MAGLDAPLLPGGGAEALASEAIMRGEGYHSTRGKTYHVYWVKQRPGRGSSQSLKLHAQINIKTMDQALVLLKDITKYMGLLGGKGFKASELQCKVYNPAALITESFTSYIRGVDNMTLAQYLKSPLSNTITKIKKELTANNEALKELVNRNEGLSEGLSENLSCSMEILIQDLDGALDSGFTPEEQYKYLKKMARPLGSAGLTAYIWTDYTPENKLLMGHELTKMDGVKSGSVYIAVDRDPQDSYLLPRQVFRYKNPAAFAEADSLCELFEKNKIIATVAEGGITGLLEGGVLPDGLTEIQFNQIIESAQQQLLKGEFTMDIEGCARLLGSNPELGLIGLKSFLSDPSDALGTTSTVTSPLMNAVVDGDSGKSIASVLVDAGQVKLLNDWVGYIKSLDLDGSNNLAKLLGGLDSGKVDCSSPDDSGDSSDNSCCPGLSQFEFIQAAELLVWIVNGTAGVAGPLDYDAAKSSLEPISSRWLNVVGGNSNKPGERTAAVLNFLGVAVMCGVGSLVPAILAVLSIVIGGLLCPPSDEGNCCLNLSERLCGSIKDLWGKTKASLTEAEESFDTFNADKKLYNSIRTLSKREGPGVGSGAQGPNEPTK